MALYYFDLTEDGALVVDEIGTELPNVGAARVEATQTMTDIARDHIPGDGPHHQLQMSVRDESGKVVINLTLAFDAEMMA